MIQMNNSGLMTIDRFNKLTGHETLHPLICMVDLSKANLTEDIRMMCNFLRTVVLQRFRARKSI